MEQHLLCTLIKKAYGNPIVFKEIVSEVLKLIPDEATCIAGSGNGGIPLATALSLGTNKKLSIVRDVEKNHGTKEMIDGHIPNVSDKIVIVDDVLTSGTSLRNTIKNLGDSTIIKCIVILKRGEAQGINHDIEYLIQI